MALILDLLDKYAFTGAAGNTVYELIKVSWRRLHAKTWEQLYIQAFSKAVEASREYLNKYKTSDGEIRINATALHQALHQELQVAPENLTFSELSNELFEAGLCDVMQKYSVLEIGGHTLSTEDYSQILKNFINQVKLEFRESILKDEPAFKRALFNEAANQKSLLLETRTFLRDQFGLSYLKLDNIQTSVEIANTKLDNLVSSNKHILDLITNLTIAQSSQQFSIGLPQPDSPPLSPSINSSRPDVVKSILESLNEHIWVALVDSTGKGKTHLSRLIHQNSPYKYVWWISLRGTDSNLVSHLAQQLVLWLMQIEANEEIWDSYIKGHLSINDVIGFISTSLKNDGLLIVDDLPDHLHNKSLFDLLHSLVTIFNQNGTRLLTTGQYNLRPDLNSAGISHLVQSSPPLSLNELQEMFRMAHAPQTILNDASSSLILGITEGHPAMAAGAIEWLKERNWELSENTLIALLSGDPTKNVREESQRIISLLDDTSKEFLYRLSLLFTNFELGLAKKIAEVEPRIVYPRERLVSLIGPWLDQFGDDQYRVTPLLKDAGKLNLLDETQIRVNKAAADYHLNQQPIEAELYGLPITLYLWSARDYRGFVSFLTGLMLNIETQSQAKRFDWATHLMTSGTEWPNEIDLDSKIMLRAAQIRVRAYAKSDAENLEKDLERLLKLATPENTRALIFAYTNAGTFLSVIDDTSFISRSRTMHRTFKALHILRENPHLVPAALQDINYAEMAWFPVGRMQGIDDIREFLAEVRNLTDEERTTLFSADSSAISVSFLLDSVWYAESKKPTEDQSWEEALQLLDEVEAVSNLEGANCLRAIQSLTRATILSDFLKRRDDALDLLKSISASPDENINFLLRFQTGLLLVDLQRYDEALSQFNAINVSNPTLEGLYRFSIQRGKTIALSKLHKWTEAEEAALIAVNLAQQHTDKMIYEHLEILGELVWIYWNTQRRVDCYSCLRQIADSLVKFNDIENPRYREVYRKLQHAIGWYVPIAVSGSPPTHVQSGDQYMPIEAGWFGFQREGLKKPGAPKDFSKTVIYTLLCMFAEAIGLLNAAWDTYQLAVSFNDTSIMPILNSQWRLYARLSVFFAEPIEAIKSGIKDLKLFKLQKEKKITLDPIPEQDMDALWMSLPREERRKAERQLMYTVFVPLYTKLLGDNLSVDSANAHLFECDNVIQSYSSAFEDTQFWLEVTKFFRLLLNIQTSQVEIPRPVIISEDPILDALWRLASSNRPHSELHISFMRQVESITFFYQVKQAGYGVYSLIGIGQFIYRFWNNVLQKLSSSGFDNFQDLLIHISPDRGEITAAQVLLIIQDNIESVTMPQEIRDSLQKISEQL